jgi:non-ribosomal peptide synthetase-like protein
LFFVFFNLLLSIFLERAITGFKPLQPTRCSIYDIRFWRHDRVWRFIGFAASMFNRTPMKGSFWRLEGVKAGKYIFDDGMSVPAITLVTIGDYPTLNPGSVIQCHGRRSLQTRRNDARLGCHCRSGGFVHYGVTMQDGSVLDADAFLMKGSEVPADGRYSGNPAREIEMPASTDLSWLWHRPPYWCHGGHPPARFESAQRVALAYC